MDCAVVATVVTGRRRLSGYAAVTCSIKATFKHSGDTAYELLLRWKFVGWVLPFLFFRSIAIHTATLLAIRLAPSSSSDQSMMALDAYTDHAIYGIIGRAEVN